MMRILLSALPSGSAKFTYTYRYMINSILVRSQYMRQMFSRSGTVLSKGVSLLWSILRLPDYSFMESLNSDAGRVSYLERTIRPMAAKCFDANILVPPPQEIFVKSVGSNLCKEFIFNASLKSDSMRNITEGENNTIDSLDYKNRILAPIFIDTTQMFEMYTTGAVSFQSDPPEIALYALDPVWLCMTYYKYRQKYGRNSDPKEFIKQYVYEPLISSYINNWILNLITEVLSNPDDSSSEIINRLYLPIKLASPDIVDKGVSALKQLVAQIRSGNIRPQDLFYCPLLLNSMSIRDHMESRANWEFTFRSGTEWIELVNLLPYLRMIALALDLSPASQVRDQFKVGLYKVALQIQYRLTSCAIWSRILDNWSKVLMNEILSYLIRN